MNFNKHLDLVDKHAYLSPSNYHWLNYTPEKLEQTYINNRMKQEGTELHELASMAIKKRVRLSSAKKALNMFVNDAIGYRMESEQILFYSYNVFGTADAILFKDNLLRIHDLKTGITKPSFIQLDIYSALFCLEYGVNPEDIQIEERIYQGNGFEVFIPEGKYIREIMNKIIDSDILLDNIKQNY